MVRVVAFDADNTLWHNERLFVETTEHFKKLLSGYHSLEWIGERLFETETRNLRLFGYGIKGFTLSMIETAIELTEGRIVGSEIEQIIHLSKRMLEAPVELLDGVEATVQRLARSYTLVIVTKGDLFDQESKVARSGLGRYMSRVEIVTEKDRGSYERVARELGVDPREFVMVGDSVKSDIMPVVEMGGHAIHVPYDTVWRHEILPDDVVANLSFLRADTIRDVPGLVDWVVEMRDRV